MDRRLSAGVVAIAFLLFAWPVWAAADAPGEATLLRVFLKEGGALTSYGEFARLGDRVVFSMPTGAPGPDVPLHLVDIPADRVDWERTARYADAARAHHYIETRAEDDYAALTSEVAGTLNDVAFTTDAARRLAAVERARKTLASWPQSHFNYRDTDVRQMLTMLDEAIADLRAATGEERFDLAVVAFTAPQPFEPVVPPPTPMEAIAQTLLAARLTESSVERTSLLNAALVGLDREAASLPEDWAAAVRTEARAAIEIEAGIDRGYKTLAERIMAAVDQRAKLGDVRSVERALVRLRLGDAALGGKRPDAVNALVTAVEAKLDATRRLRLARDRWALRAPVFLQYRLAIGASVDQFARLKPLLERIKSLAGSSPASLAAIRRNVAQVVKAAAAVTPPDELRPTHALLVSAAELAGQAARIRREATLSGDMARAWDASSAAAGALMLGARVRSELQELLRPPQLQ
jgi:hypothetical protein